MLKAYKFRLYPTAEQKTSIEKHISSCRFVYNWALAEKIKTYEQTNHSISQFDLNKKITILNSIGVTHLAPNISFFTNYHIS